MSNATSGGATDVKLAPNAGRLNSELHGVLVDECDKYNAAEASMGVLADRLWNEGHKRPDNFIEEKDPVFYNEVKNACRHYFEGKMTDRFLTKQDKLSLEGGEYNVGYILKADIKNLPEIFTERREECGSAKTIRRYWQMQMDKPWDSLTKRIESKAEKFAAVSDPTGQVAVNKTKTLTCKDLVKVLRRHQKGADNPILLNNEYGYLVKMLKVGFLCANV